MPEGPWLVARPASQGSTGCGPRFAEGSAKAAHCSFGAIAGIMKHAVETVIGEPNKISWLEEGHVLTVGSDWGAAMYPNMLGRLVVRAVVPVDDLNAEAEGFPCWLPAPAWARTHQVGCSIVLDALAAVYLKDIDMGINSVLDAVYDLVAALGNVTVNACMVVTRPPCFCWKTWSSNNRMRRPHSLAIILYTKRFRCFLSNTYCPRCQASREGGREIERERERARTRAACSRHFTCSFATCLTLLWLCG